MREFWIRSSLVETLVPSLEEKCVSHVELMRVINEGDKWFLGGSFMYKDGLDAADRDMKVEIVGFRGCLYVESGYIWDWGF